MANKRRSNNPLPNYVAGLKPDEHEKWVPEASPFFRGMVPEPSRSPSEKDQYMRQWMRQMHLMKDAQRRWGTGTVNRKVVEAEVRRRLLNEGW